MNASPIERYDGAGVVFTFGGDALGTWIFLVLAVVLFVGFVVRMMIHENHAYAAVCGEAAPEPGPPVESEPSPAGSP